MIKKTIVDPTWGSLEKDKIVYLIEYQYPNGSVRKIESSLVKDPTKEVDTEWKAFLDKFPADLIDDNSARVATTQYNLQKKSEKHKAFLEKNKELEMLTDYKMILFGMDEIKNSPHENIKYKMRIAQTIPELLAYGSALIYDTLEKENKDDTTS